jgi:ribosomal protein S18 acetylase RimI-like enzyme
MITVREFEQADWPAVWAFMAPVFRSGETYAFSADISEEEAYGIWIEAPAATFVAIDEDGAVLGTYYIKANQPGAGAHVCNCGYIVAEHTRGRGVATVMCEHSQREAVRRGFRAMQFNFVVSTNEGAVRLWQKLGYDIVGTLPGAFEHPTQGFVDAYVMYKQLGSLV